MKKKLHQWQLQEAKNKLSKVVNLAINEGPQMITVHGREAAVIMSAQDYQKLQQPAGSLVNFLSNSPLATVELDVTRRRDVSRDVDL